MLKTILYLLFVARSASNQELDDRRIPPSFAEHPHAPLVIYVQEGFSRTLSCSPTGLPRPTISWLRNGNDIEADEVDFSIKDNGSLEIKKVSSETKGNYICLAKNDFGIAASRVLSVEVAYMLSDACIPDTKKISVMEGKSISLHVASVKSSPPSHIQWYKLSSEDPDTKPLAMNERMYHDVSGTLWFGYTLMEDASNGELYKGRRQNKVIDLTVSCGVYDLHVSKASGGLPDTLEATMIHSTESPHKVLEKRLAILECFITSRPFEKVKWSREDRKPLSKRCKNDEWGFSLMIEDVRAEDAGEYSCQAGEVKHTIKVVVEASPAFKSIPRNLNVTEGEDVVINCSSHATPWAGTEWWINADRINYFHAIPRISISKDLTNLRIRSVCRDCADGRRTDSMVVQCNVNNSHGYIFSSSYVNVLKRTKVQLVAGEEYYEMETGFEKMLVILNCTATSDPLTPVTPTWYNVTNPNHQERLVTDENMFVNRGLLVFNLTEQRSRTWKNYHGEYACIASTPYSNSSVRTKIFVRSITPTMASMNRYWWALLIAGILLLLIIITILACSLYNVGDTYNVNKNELKNGNNPVKEIEEKDFRVYLRPEAVDFRGSQATLISKSSRQLSDEEESPGKFFEDGSFIGDYTNDRQGYN